MDTIPELIKIDFGNFLEPPLIDDVRIFIVKAASNGYANFGYPGQIDLKKRNYKTNNWPFRIGTAVDGSYQITVKWRCYLQPGYSYPVYYLIDFNNTDPKGYRPRLLKVNIGAEQINQTQFKLIITDVYSNSEFNNYDYYSSTVLYDITPYKSQIECVALNFSRVIYYTLDGSQPNSNSSIYDLNNPPILQLGQSYTVRAYSSTYDPTDFIDSDVVSAFIDTNQLTTFIPLFYNDLVYPILSISPPISNVFSGTLTFFYDSLFIGFDDVLVTIVIPPNNYVNPVIYYSLNGEDTLIQYTGPFPLPQGWKQSTALANIASIRYFVRDGNFITDTQSYSFYILYPNYDLFWSYFQQYYFAPRNGRANQLEVTVTNHTLTLKPQGKVNTFYFSLYNMYYGLTAYDDFRYFEIKLNDLIDIDKSLFLLVNTYTLSQNGSITMFNSDFTIGTPLTGPNPNLAWKAGDVIGGHFNYKDGSTRFNVNNGPWSDFLTPSQINYIQIVFQYDNSVRPIGALSFDSNMKGGDQIYPLPDSNTLALDTSPSTDIIP